MGAFLNGCNREPESAFTRDAVGARKKQPRIQESFSPGGRQPQVGREPINNNSETPVWSIRLFDLNGPWGRTQIRPEHLWDSIFVKLKDYESMTWGSILQDKHDNHSVGTADLSKDARQRLEFLKLDDRDHLFRLRLNGTQRVWGIRDGRVMMLLWWDPDHAVCPSKLKNT